MDEGTYATTQHRKNNESMAASFKTFVDLWCAIRGEARVSSSRDMPPGCLISPPITWYDRRTISMRSVRWEQWLRAVYMFESPCFVTAISIDAMTWIEMNKFLASIGNTIRWRWTSRFNLRNIAAPHALITSYPGNLQISSLSTVSISHKDHTCDLAAQSWDLLNLWVIGTEKFFGSIAHVTTDSDCKERSAQASSKSFLVILTCSYQCWL